MNLDRKTHEPILPLHRPTSGDGDYDLYPAFPLADDLIASGYEALAEILLHENTVILDGYGGVFWDVLRQELQTRLAAKSVRVTWHDMQLVQKTPDSIADLLAPFLGGDDPLFGTRFTGSIGNFFDPVGAAQL